MHTAAPFLTEHSALVPQLLSAQGSYVAGRDGVGTAGRRTQPTYHPLVTIVMKHNGEQIEQFSSR